MKQSQTQAIQFIIIPILLISFNLCKGETIKFKGDWMMQDHYKIQTGQKFEFDFKNSSNNSVFLNNTIYDMQIIDNNAEKDKKYTQLCKIKHMRLAPLYDYSKQVDQSYDNSLQSQIIDFIVFNGNILAYIFQSGKIVISNIQQHYNSNDDQYPNIIINKLYQDQLTSIDNQSYVKLAYHSEFQVLMIYISSGDIFYVDISQYIKENPQLNNNQTNNKQNENIQKTDNIYKVGGVPKHEKAKKFIVLNGHLIFVTINGKIKGYNIQKNDDKILSLQKSIFDLSDDSADFIDMDNHQQVLILLDIHKGIIFYQYNRENEQYQIYPDLFIPIEGGTQIASQQLNTIVVGTKDKLIQEYFIDFENKKYILNNEIQLDSHINQISIEERYLFISAQNRNNNYFTPLNVLKSTSQNIEQHQTMIKFGQHFIQVKFALLKNTLKSQTEIYNNQQKQKKFKGNWKSKEYSNSIASAFKKNPVFIQLVDNNKLEIIPYYYEQEALVCSSESTQKLISNVNEKYEYTILYNSTDCQEKERYYKVEKQSTSQLDLRKSYCSSHGIVSFEVDFTKYEQEEFEFGLVFMGILIFTTILCFRHYKNQKIQKMFALKESMSTEETKKKRKRLNLHQESMPLIPSDTKID